MVAFQRLTTIESGFKSPALKVVAGGRLLDRWSGAHGGSTVLATQKVINRNKGKYLDTDVKNDFRSVYHNE